MRLSEHLDENVSNLNEILNLDSNFDIIRKGITIAGRDACIYFIDGFLEEAIMEKLLEFFYKLKPEEMPMTAKQMIDHVVPYVEVTAIEEEDLLVQSLLSGITCLLIDGYDTCIGLDCRSYPMRGVDEPSKDKALRGSKDGFVETVVFNTALIRRRIRSPKLSMEILTAGRTSRTDIVLCYMQDRVDRKLLREIRGRINAIKVDALTMNQESLAECIYDRKWFNPFPKFKFTERPDAASAAILEGNIVVLVDNSPQAMVVPTSIFDIVEEADDYYFPPVTGSYLRLTRFLIALITLLLTPVFLLLFQNPQWVPPWLSFIEIKDTINVPIVWQFLMLELAIDGLRLAAINTPSMLSTPLSVVAGIVLGQFTVDSGWFNAEIMMYMAFVAIANYTQSSYELSYALKFMRLIMLVLTSLFDLWGFLIGLLITVVAIVGNKTIAGKSYIYPLLPLNLTQLKKRFLRLRLKE
ncbi:MAG: spore germination protein [Lachnospiraceae bacterium]|nr:spore germination protein [Lachnospiraceae bacterium]MCI9307033.1 spore germination protein [Lachnospiraceae bacterium]MCI9681634.1 spore germination protein [Lachnospiraceae bacterium]